ncbi:MAG: malto-oligosyltrehalose trehalohydrolase, partial [Chloroflexi bacterium]|nr:malto-oligosyltrehalose trehalohydrolase [Chloroflexota bacterium]
MTFRHLGAIVTPGGLGVRVWAPRAGAVGLVVDGRELPMARMPDGSWQVECQGAVGSRYAFRIDGRGPFPDPYSRHQPEGVHAPSAVFDPTTHRWHDTDWSGLRVEELVIYQCHVGTATPAGTLDGLIEQLPRLARLGVTAVQLLPLAEFPGRWNWGYDGVDLFAVSRNYGGPAALQRFVDAAHQHG